MGKKNKENIKGDNVATRSEDSADNKAKKVYESPALFEYGDIERYTAGGSGKMNESGMMTGMMRRV